METMEDYRQQSGRTDVDVSNGLQLEGQTIAELWSAFNAVIAVAGSIDVMKKRIFYGKTGHTGLFEVDGEKVRSMRLDPRDAHLLHAMLGMTGEVAEIADEFRRYLYHEGELDRVAFGAETGDLLWYIAKELRALDYTFEQVANANLNKLARRFPDKFDRERAKAPDKADERRQLELDLA